MNAAPRATRPAYYFEAAKPRELLVLVQLPTCSSPSYHNPIARTQEWHGMLASGACATRADLARKLGVSRVRVTQVLGLLDLAPKVVDAIVALGDPLPKPIVTERTLRAIRKLPVEEQNLALRRVVGSTETS